MNLPVEICAIVEDYLPLEFDKKARKDLWRIARYYLSNQPRPRPRDIENRSLFSGLGSRKLKIAFTSCTPCKTVVKSRYLSILVNPLEDCALHVRDIDGFVIACCMEERESSNLAVWYDFEVIYIQ